MTNAIATAAPPLFKPTALPAAPAPTATETTAPKPKGFEAKDSVDVKAPKKQPEYAPGPSTAQIESGAARLKMGQKGPAVVDVQKKLGLPVTGKFDKNTEVGVALFQKKAGLPTTGVVNDKTLKALDPKPAATSAPAPGPATPPPSGGDAIADDMAAKMKDGKADAATAKAALEKAPGIVHTDSSYSKELKEQIHRHNLEHLTKKLSAKQPLNPEETKLAQGYLDFHYKDLSKVSPSTDGELNQAYGGAYGFFAGAAKNAGMKATGE